MNEKEIFEDIENTDGFFTIAEIMKKYDYDTQKYNDDYLNIVKLLYDFENEGLIYRISHEKVDYYITPENFLKLIREQNLANLLGLGPDK